MYPNSLCIHTPNIYHCSKNIWIFEAVVSAHCIHMMLFLFITHQLWHKLNRFNFCNKIQSVYNSSINRWTHIQFCHYIHINTYLATLKTFEPVICLCLAQSIITKCLYKHTKQTLLLSLPLIIIAVTIIRKSDNIKIPVKTNISTYTKTVRCTTLTKGVFYCY